MNIIFNDIYKIEKINNLVGYGIKNTFEYQEFSSINGFCLKLTYNLNDDNYSFLIYLSDLNKNEILEQLEYIKKNKLIKDFHDVFYKWCQLSLITIENKRDELSSVKNSLYSSYAKVSLNNHSKYLSYINGNIDNLNKENIFEDDFFRLFLSGNKKEEIKSISFELIEKNTNITHCINLLCSEGNLLIPKIFHGFEKKESVLIEFYETKKLNAVKKYLPQIVSSAIKNDIPDGFSFFCERKYLKYSIIDFKNNNDVISMKFNL